MTLVTYKKVDKNFTFIKISGHAGLVRSGRNIVCAGISSIVEGSSGFLKSFYKEFIFISKGKCEVNFFVLKNNSEIQICLRMMIYQLKNIEFFYPNYISIKEI